MKSLFLETRRGKVFVHTAGKGQPLVFIHGALLNSDLWKPQLELFSERYYCVAYDLRGHARSGPSDLNRYSTSVFSEDLSAVLDALMIRRPILCGLSMGGMIAQSFAAKYPERVRALILCDTGISTSQHFSDKVVNQIVGIVTTPAISFLGVERYHQITHLINDCVSRSPSASRSTEGMEFSKNAVEMIQPAEIVKIVTAVRKFDSNPIYRPKVPTLIVNGENDSPLILRQAKMLQQVYLSSRYRVIPNAGHLANLENPEAFNQVVSDFLDALAVVRRKRAIPESWFGSTLVHRFMRGSHPVRQPSNSLNGFQGTNGNHAPE